MALRGLSWLKGRRHLSTDLGGMADKLKVLFCGKDWHAAFEYTAEALSQDAGVEVLQCERAQLMDYLPSAHVAVPLGATLGSEALAGASRLKLILQYGVGVEGVDIPTATERGIWVSNIPSAGTGNALSCAEMAVFLMLATLRRLPLMQASMRERGLGVPIGETLFGKTVLLLGFGGIAKELAVRLKPFGVRLLAVRKGEWGRVGEEAAESLLDDRGGPSDLLRLAGQADILAVTVAQNAENRGLVNGELLAACKPGVHIINVARGGLLDYEAVREGLESGHIGGLGLDVQWREPWDPDHHISNHPRVVLTPHVAGVTELSYRTMAGIVAEDVRRIQQGLPPTVQLNKPKGS